MIVTYILIAVGLWFVISLSMFFWHTYRGKQVAKVTKKYERSLSRGPKILLAGDSVVFGVGATAPETSIAGLFGRDFPQATIKNIGVSGAETDGLVQQLTTVHGQRFDLVVIIIGANDVVHFANLTKSLENLGQGLSLARDLSDQVILMPEGNMGNPPLFPQLASLFFTPRSRLFRVGAMTIAAQHQTTYVDVFHERKDDYWRKDPTHYYAADFFHPADKGYLDWYTAIRGKVDASVL